MIEMAARPRSVRAAFFALSYLQSRRFCFWEKIDFTDRLEFLDAFVPIALIKSLPDDVKDYDRQLDREMYDGSALKELHSMHDFGRMASHAGMGLGGLGGGEGHSLDGMGGTSGEDSAEARPKVELPKRNWEEEEGDD